MKTKVFSKDNCKLVIIICFLIFCSRSNSQTVLMTEEIGREIFEQNKYFLIYVYQQATPKVSDTFEQYCQQRSNCAILNSTVQEYDNLRKFIGKKSRQFFLILNVPFEKKYVLNIGTNGISKNDLKNFQKGYEQQKLDPFQASEPIPKTNSEICTQLVGKTYDDFLKQHAILKVIYTYTKHEGCQVCLQQLQIFKDLAEKMHNKDVLIFGYVDVFLNDISEIPEPIVPHFYIYQGDHLLKEVSEADIDQLPEIIKAEVHRIMIEIENHEEHEDESSSNDRKQQL